MRRTLARHASLPRVQAVPVVRGRLAFAQAALEAIEAEHPDFVAVDLPGFFNGSEWLETALSRLPLATSVVIKRSSDHLLLPFTPSDACTMAAWQARRAGVRFGCLDNFSLIAKQRDRIFGPENGIPAGGPLPANLVDYFRPAWAEMDLTWRGLWSARTGLARAAGIARELERASCEHRRILFVADYRTWWAVNRYLDRPLRVSPPPLRGEAHAVLIFEDALALWHAGLAEMPYPVLEFYRAAEAGEKFDPATAVLHAPGVPAVTAASLRAEERTTASLLDAIEAASGNSAAAKAAASLLSYPAPTCDDAADCIPAFATITGEGIGRRYWLFDPPDVFDAVPYYEPSQAETAAFFPPAEQAARAGWGPGGLPYITRGEAARIAPSGDNRWTVPANMERISEAATLLYRHVSEMALDPPLSAAPGRFTPVVFVWSNESDGDIRTIDDSNATRRRQQFGELREDQPLPDGCPPADVIHTFCATRCLNADWWVPMVQYDVATSIAVTYSGPETGPERYQAVLAHQPPHLICRDNPAHDADLAALPKDQVSAAFAVKWAANLVIVAAHAGWRPSSGLMDMANVRGVRMVVVPVEVIPATMQGRLRRRVFIEKNARMNRPAGRRLEDRFANWRLQPGA